MSELISKLKDTVIDGHTHIEGVFGSDGSYFLHGFDEYKKRMGLKCINVAALPSGKRDVSNNILCAFYKLANPQDYAHGGLTFKEYPVNPDDKDDMSPLTQYKELMEIGFDGVKLLEGKPNLHKRLGIPLCHEYFDEFYDALEKDGTHLIFHVNDPEEFWDPDKVSDELKKLGWYYGDGEYASNEEVYRQIGEILKKHPNLKVTFAHFFFYSRYPEKLVEIFEKYPNVCVDLTPGGEMYIAFYENPEYYKEFFKKYSDRILLGTDSIFPDRVEAPMWLLDRVYRYLSTSDTVKSFGDRLIPGIELQSEYRDKILHDNFVSRVASEPKKINKEALKRYIEKYKHLITNKVHLEEIEKLSKELL